MVIYYDRWPYKKGKFGHEDRQEQRKDCVKRHKLNIM